MNFEVLLDGANLLGESPLWCVRRERLFWVDIRAPALYACTQVGGDLATWPMPEVIGTFAFREHGDGLVVALKAGLHDFDLDRGELALIAEPERERPTHRFNEGKCDTHGRFLAGTMNDVVREPTGILYRLDPDRRVHVLRVGIAVPNSLAFSPDGRRMYFADTERRVIGVSDYDPETGACGEERLFADLRHGEGRPDGATVDSDGCLWSAEVVTGRIVRYAPDGRLLDAWSLPVSRATSLAFGGTDLRTLFVTTASARLTPEQRAREPHAGALFAARAPAQGLAAARYGG